MLTILSTNDEKNLLVSYSFDSDDILSWLHDRYTIDEYKIYKSAGGMFTGFLLAHEEINFEFLLKWHEDILDISSGYLGLQPIWILNQT